MLKDKMRFWIENNLNVLFTGKHGIGKTARIVDLFDECKINWRYFSASTMDPWVDFIGVPKAVKLGDKEVLELIRPVEFANDEVEAIFFDEFNRSHKKVRNAVMELIQFKSINGRPFKSLRFIWAAINPDDDETYDVEKLDPAQIDRFQVLVDMPYECDLAYFTKQYGESDAFAAITWWKTLPPEIRDKVTPRRLDYALKMSRVSGDLRDILPKESNVSALITSLSVGPIDRVLIGYINSNDTESSKEFLNNANNARLALPTILKKSVFRKFFLPLFGNEFIASLIRSNKVAKKFIFNNYKLGNFKDIISDLYVASRDGRFKKDLEESCPFLTGSMSSSVDSLILSNDFARLRQLTKGNTNDRRKILIGLQKFVCLRPLNEEEAYEVLTIVDLICLRSHPNTLNKMIDLPFIIKKCSNILGSVKTRSKLKQLNCKLSHMKNYKIYIDATWVDYNSVPF